MKKNKIVLVILDGWGIAQTWGGNAIGLADTPTIDKLVKKYPYTTLEASGEAVGLPYHEPGNSEVGHLNIGSGEVVYQGLTAINKMISDKSFYKNSVLKKTMQYIIDNNSSLHFIGLMSDGGAHSHISHLYALLEMATSLKLKQVFIHVFTDGRDTAPTSAINFAAELENKIKELGVGKIATVSGRYYAMDRDNRWDRVQKVYDALVLGNGEEAETASVAISNSYARDITDEFIIPTIIDKRGIISDNDGVIFFNFRSDRARELTQALIKDEFEGFTREKLPKKLLFTTFATYQEGLPVSVAFESRKVSNPLAGIFDKNELNHFHVAETEKYPHVTYFFNGGEEKPFKKESRLLIPSPKVPTYDLKPEMSAKKITEKVIEQFKKYDFSVVNFANTDMVGHTGNLEATIKATETVDNCLGQLVEKISSSEMTAIVTADHGNAEQMINPLTGLPDTEHTNNPVPFIIVSDDKKHNLHENGKLCDLAPTILELMNIEPPKEMVGKSLISK